MSRTAEGVVYTDGKMDPPLSQPGLSLGLGPPARVGAWGAEDVLRLLRDDSSVENVFLCGDAV